MSTWLPVILSSIIGGVAALAVARITLRGQREGQKSSPYGELAERVVVLEKNDRDKADLISQQARRIRMLEDDRDTLVDAVSEQSAWQAAGSNPPPPTITERALAVLRRHREEAARLAAEPSPATD